MSKMTRVNDPKCVAKTRPPDGKAQARAEFRKLMRRAAEIADTGTDRFGKSLRRGSPAWNDRYYAALSSMHARTPVASHG